MNDAEKTDRRLDMLRHLPTLLQRWRGGHAKISELTASHSTLLIVIRCEGKVGHLKIACVDPLFIQGSIEWNDANIVVDIHGDDGFVVHDTQAGVRVVTTSIEIKEHNNGN